MDLSPPLSLGFVALTAGMALLFVWGVARAPGRPRSPSATLAAVGVVALYLGVSFALAQTGVLARVDARPPPVGMMLLAMSGGMVALAFSPLGDRLLAWPLGVLIGVQSFRIAVELLLAAVYADGALPVEMTYHGLNFDIVTGLAAVPLALWAWRGSVPNPPVTVITMAVPTGGPSGTTRVPRGLVLAWNVLGVALLAVVVTMAALSAFGVWETEPRVLLPAMWPGVWLPAWLVQLGLFGHVLVFRKLARG